MTSHDEKLQSVIYQAAADFLRDAENRERLLTRYGLTADEMDVLVALANTHPNGDPWGVISVEVLRYEDVGTDGALLGRSGRVSVAGEKHKSASPGEFYCVYLTPRNDLGEVDGVSLSFASKIALDEFPLEQLQGYAEDEGIEWVPDVPDTTRRVVEMSSESFSP